MCNDHTLLAKLSAAHALLATLAEWQSRTCPLFARGRRHMLNRRGQRLRSCLRYDWRMCGRYALYGPISRKRPAPDSTHDWLADLIGNINKRAPRFNFAPTQESPIVVGHEDAD